MKRILTSYGSMIQVIAVLGVAADQEAPAKVINEQRLIL